MTTEKFDVDEVLDAVMLAETEPSHKALVRWVKRYPQFRKDLEDFFVSWSESEMARNFPDGEEFDEDAVAERAVKRTLAKLRSQTRTRS